MQKTLQADTERGMNKTYPFEFGISDMVFVEVWF